MWGFHILTVIAVIIVHNCICLWNWDYLIFFLFILNRSISWTHRYGILYSVLFSVVCVVLSIILGRWDWAHLTWELILDVYTILDSYLLYSSRFAQWEWWEVGFVPYLKPSICLLFLQQCQKRKKECFLVFWRRKYSRWKMFMPFWAIWRCSFPLMSILFFKWFLVFRN